jgi:hypothetical protein
MVVAIPLRLEKVEKGSPSPFSAPNRFGNYSIS